MFCVIIDNLAVLPLKLKTVCMECLKQNIPNVSEDLLFYFETNYVNGAYRRIGNIAGVNVVRL